MVLSGHCLGNFIVACVHPWKVFQSSTLNGLITSTFVMYRFLNFLIARYVAETTVEQLKRASVKMVDFGYIRSPN